MFRELIYFVEEEYGLPMSGPITVPCDAAFIEHRCSTGREKVDSFEKDHTCLTGRAKADSFGRNELDWTGKDCDLWEGEHMLDWTRKH
ncbi:hypothetical protein RJ639_043423 [Escallonia herrerae]|uniref:Uncharacterized protein n=1 Tax=Escallonia herrerae TaxID=1293975 RepID=A0AA89B3Z6_9ASTE|nr:hypothetical protein RJ639_043423 [Escallonia herrerae]